MSKRGKNYQAVAEKVERARLYSPQEAVALVKQTARAKFDETVEVHLRLGIDPRHAEQQVRDVVVLPNGLGKTVRVAVFAEGEAVRIAEEAGADVVGSDDLVKRIQDENFLEFDVAIAVPEMMGKVGRLGRVLGPRNLMPNPKAGTVVPEDNLPRAIQEAKAGRVEFRNDKTGNLHVPIGKASFSQEALMENLAALMDAVRRKRPPAAKGQFIRRMVMTTTMGPGIKVDPVAAQAIELN
jgi:large subunit ribosomal protein L1